MLKEEISAPSDEAKEMRYARTPGMVSEAKG
jgi:hypothetical protein